MALTNCKACQKEIGEKVAKCPHCGTDQRNWFMRHKFLSFVGIVIVLVVLVSVFSGEPDPATVSSASGTSGPAQTAKVGDTITTDKFEITVMSVEQRDSVGDDLFNSKPAEGGVYIAVQWKYKNISDEPVSSFSVPTIKLFDSNDTKYSSDVGSSGSFATELKLDRKLLSDLNPGITVNDADVFEVARDSFEKGGWKLMLDSDKDVYVALD